MKRKNIIVPLLITASLFIWSRNIYLVFVGVTQKDEEPDNLPIQENWDFPEILSPFPAQNQVFVYQAEYRDPFQHWLTQPIKKKKTPPPMKKPVIKKNEKPEPHPPKLRFTGVLQDSSGILAIIEGPSGSIYFVREKDVVEGVSVLRVEADSIYCQFDDKKFRLGLSR